MLAAGVRARLRRRDRLADRHAACGLNRGASGGWDELQAQLHNELLATRQKPLSGPVELERDRLTASELRVARLAADGRSNLEVAQTLYISVKTVDTHLSRVYAKLGLSGQGARRELATALKP
jgi:DNA-binding CsgD family transcriptional regulator